MHTAPILGWSRAVMQQSRAVISWEDGSVRVTEWLRDDGSQEIVDRTIKAVSAILNQRAGQKCAIKWEQQAYRETRPARMASRTRLALS
jgi:hypothetical protein